MLWKNRYIREAYLSFGDRGPSSGASLPPVDAFPATQRDAFTTFTYLASFLPRTQLSNPSSSFKKPGKCFQQKILNSTR